MGHHRLGASHAAPADHLAPGVGDLIRSVLVTLTVLLLAGCTTSEPLPSAFLAPVGTTTPTPTSTPSLVVVALQDPYLYDSAPSTATAVVEAPVAPTTVPTAVLQFAAAAMRVERVQLVGVEAWRTTVESYFGANTDRALAVMACESHGNPGAIGSVGEQGLFQIRPEYHSWRASGQSLLDGTINIMVAAGISNGGNDWSAWSCKP